ncbi:MAG TPA: DUF362 domain-containing protein [Bryobacteraceae bacterium]|nr:DUF362 domain-containing protein [Bryobacteraceae bacterium]HPU71891.1 DUF362 domain-containing protein [Bryobacteraceae bacterium]
MGLAARPPAQSGAGKSQEEQGTPYPYYQGKSVVSIVKGENRRKLICEALIGIDDQILPKLKEKKYVILKPNCVAADFPAACTDRDAILGVLDYLAPRFKGPILIAESSASRTTREAFENLRYASIVSEHRPRNISLVDLNEGEYEVINVMDANLHLTPVRLIKRLMDPDAFVISIPKAKTHVICTVTLSVKNVVLAAPLRLQPKQAPPQRAGFAVPWNDKWKIHPTYRLANYNMMLVAQRIRPSWGVAVIDAFEGMERNGPVAGIAVDHRVAVASTDYIAADRVMAEAMGIKPETVGHLVYCAQSGLGQFDPAKIELRGETLAAARKECLLPANTAPLEEWMSPMDDVPSVVPAQ